MSHSKTGEESGFSFEEAPASQIPTHAAGSGEESAKDDVDIPAEGGEETARLEKRARRGAMPAALRERIEKDLQQHGEAAFHRRKHRRYGPVQARVLPAEDLVHEKVGESRKGHGNRVHYICSNPKCGEIRRDKWERHVIEATSDV